MTTPNERPAHTPKKGRSPSYPSLSLDVALNRAEQLYKQDGRNAAPIATIQAHWGFKANSGPANLAVASLKKYGLLADEGSGSARTARITDLAYDALYHPDPDEKAALIKLAALTPKIHREIWDQYAVTGLPSDATLKFDLVKNREFTETGAAEFIAQFRKTVAFANLSSGDILDTQDDEYDEGENVASVVLANPPAVYRQQEPRRRHLEQTQPPAGGTTIPIILDGGSTTISVHAQFPVSEESWKQFMAILTAMKPGLVAQPNESSIPDEPADWGSQ